MPGDLVPILAKQQLITQAGISIALVRLWVEVAFQRANGSQVFRRCLFDSGAALSVVPYSLQQAQHLRWTPLPGSWPPAATTWSGVPCVIGRTDVWLPVPKPPYLLGPLVMIAKFAQATPRNLTAPAPILLGLNFLYDHSARSEFMCHTLPYAGIIDIP